MDIFKIYKAFFTFWIIIFAIIYLTSCKNSINPLSESFVNEKNTIIVGTAPTINDSLINENKFVEPVTTAVKPIQKPVILIYLK